MFNKQKEKLKSQINNKKYELKQAAKQKITDVMPDPVKSVVDYKEQKDISKATKYVSFDVAGTFYHETEIKSLGKLNPKFQSDADGTQYEYKNFTVSPVALEFEPTNEHDPYAIKVLIDDVFIGYVPRPDNIEIGKLIRTGKAKKYTAKFYGGDSSFHKDGRMYTEQGDIECTIRVYYI